MSSRYFKFSQDICSVAVYLNDDDVLDRTWWRETQIGVVDWKFFFFSLLFSFFGNNFFLFMVERGVEEEERR